MREYTVIYERGPDGGWGAYAPDLPGLGAAAKTFEEVDLLIREGILIHIESLKEDGQSIPEPLSFARTISVPPSFTLADDPLLKAVGIGKRLSQGKDADEFIAELRSGWDDK